MDTLENGSVRPVDGPENADPTSGTPEGVSAVERQPKVGSKPPKRRRRVERDNGEFLAFLRRILVAVERRGAELDPEDLAEVLKIQEHLDRAMTGAVANMLRNGFSWTEIAAPLGITRQAAHKRWAARIDALSQENTGD